MLKIDQALEAIKELKAIAESAQFKADLQKMKEAKGLPPAEKLKVIAELKVVYPPFAKLVKAFTGEKIDVLVDDIAEVIEFIFDTE